MKDLREVVEKVQQVDDGVNNLIIPLLKDTIADSNRHNKRLFILNLILAISILFVSVFSQVLVAIQNQQYAEFLSQFEFESTVYQDFDTTDESKIINPTITSR